MDLDRDVCYRALRTRDTRFDGRFFTAVRSTGIYCRPVCPARTPRKEHCTFVPTAAAAQELGFRPCLRCRPESSPETPVWNGATAIVARALRLISAGALDDGTVAALAARVGVGERQLRRLFVERLGASPVAVARTRRVLFAKKLLDETGLGISQVALASGFQSLRRFNDVVLRTFGRSPRELRRRRGRGRSEADLQLQLAFRPPFDWGSLLAFLAARAIPGVEQVADQRYLRTVRIGGREGWIEVRCVAAGRHLLAQLHGIDCRDLLLVVERLRRMFDLGADPEEIGRLLADDPLLAGSVEGRPGLRVPGAWDGFELAVRAILGQQVSVAAATTLAGDLGRRFGVALKPADERPAELAYLFPDPATLARIDPAELGIPQKRAAAIVTLARAVAGGRLSFDGDDAVEETLDRFSRIPGVGPWTTQYVALRALREPDAFPSGDLVLRRAAGSDERVLSQRELERRSERWRPWRAYAALHLWSASAEPISSRRTEA